MGRRIKNIAYIYVRVPHQIFVYCFCTKNKRLPTFPLFLLVTKHKLSFAFPVFCIYFRNRSVSVSKIILHEHTNHVTPFDSF